MAAKINHPCFPQPKNKKALVWRYMDFSKFFSLIANQALFLCRADNLGDPFEGSYPEFNIEGRKKFFEDIIGHSPDKDQESMIKEITKGQSGFAKYWRQMIYINCWHMNEYESDLWKLYTKSSEAVVIQTTYEKLVNVLPSEVYVGCVTYIDYEKKGLSGDNPFYPFMHKRESFAHEREVRIVHQEKWQNLSSNNDKGGIKISVNLASLVENVYVAPKNPAWYRALVEEVLKKYDIDRQVHLSDLDKDPLY